jgi:hypothetical protein
LGIPTLATRKSDRLDFHEVAVWRVRAAFERVWRARSRGAAPKGIKLKGTAVGL